MITAIWNRLEEDVNEVMLRMGDVHHKNPLAGVLGRAGNVTKADMLPKLAIRNKWDRRGVEALRHFVKAFNICRENRNTVLHARYEFGEDGSLRLTRPSTTGQMLTFSTDLKMLRIIAHDTDRTLRYFLTVMDVSWHKGNVFYAGDWRKKNPGKKRPSWPRKFVLPHKLDPLPPP